MAKDHIRDYDLTAGNNTDVDGVNIAEGTAPSNINDAIREVMSHEAEQHGDIRGGLTSGGSQGAYTLTSNESLAAYAQSGGLFVFEANHAMPDTATASLNIDAVGAKPLRKEVSVVPLQNDIKANQMVLVAYEAATDVFQMMSSPGNAVLTQDLLGEPTTALGIVPLKSIAGHLHGLVLSQDADTDHDIQIAAGVAVDNAESLLMRVSAALTKQIDVDWVAGDDAGGFPSALTLSNATWYHVFLIGKTDGTIDAGFDTSLTATNLFTDATGYTLYRRIGSVLTDGTANIVDFVQSGDEFFWKTPQGDFSGSPVTTAAAITLSVPPDVRVHAHVLASVSTVNQTYTVHVSYYPTDADARTPAVGNAQLRATSTFNAFNQVATSVFDILSDTSKQINHDSSSVLGTETVSTLGWRDFRGA